jgi:dolichyl-phosphate beta-glucosyltransferase
MLLHMSSLAIIVPCYNEEARLDREKVSELVNGIGDAIVFFVNDGSSDNTEEVLKELAGKYPNKVFYLSYSNNEGKAKVISKGITHLIKNNNCSYIGYMDADFSTPVKEFIRLYEVLVEEKVSFIFGSRIKKLNSGINRKASRHLIGRVIATLIDMRFKLGIYDTQCGAKIFARDHLAVILDRPLYCSWLFDAELFIRLKKKNMLANGIELPIIGWKNVGGSKLSLATFPAICLEFITLLRKY